MFRKTMLAALIASSLGGMAAPASSAEYGYRHAPPPAHHEVAPPPRHGYVWVPGYWERANRSYHWVEGRWVRERRGQDYENAHWVERDGRWYLVQGGWRRDRDGDGVPNRYDRRPDNPYRY